MEITKDLLLFPTFSVLVSNPKRKKKRGKILAQEVVGSYMSLCCCSKKNMNAFRPSDCCFSHSACCLPTQKKIFCTVANPTRGMLNRENIKIGWPRTPPAQYLSQYW